MTTPPSPQYPYPKMDPRRLASGKTTTSYFLLAHLEKARQERRERLLRDLSAVATKALTAAPEPSAPLPQTTIPSRTGGQA